MKLNQVGKDITETWTVNNNMEINYLKSGYLPILIRDELESCLVEYRNQNSIDIQYVNKCENKSRQALIINFTQSGLISIKFILASGDPDCLYIQRIQEDKDKLRVRKKEKLRIANNPKSQNQTLWPLESSEGKTWSDMIYKHKFIPLRKLHNLKLNINLFKTLIMPQYRLGFPLFEVCSRDFRKFHAILGGVSGFQGCLKRCYVSTFLSHSHTSCFSHKK